MNKYHVVRKSHDATQKEYPQAVHFNLTRDWFERNPGIKNVTLKAAKKLRSSRGLLGREVEIINRLSFNSCNFLQC